MVCRNYIYIQITCDTIDKSKTKKVLFYTTNSNLQYTSNSELNRYIRQFLKLSSIIIEIVCIEL